MNAQFKHEYAKGAFQTLDEDQEEYVMEIVAQYHVRNGVELEDGSRGEIVITRDQMNDLLAYLLTSGE